MGVGMSTDSRHKELAGLEEFDGADGEVAESSALARSSTAGSGTAGSGTAGSGIMGSGTVGGSTFQMQPPDALVAAHQGLVISIANSIYRRVPRHIPKEDLISYGQVGLVQAARTFRPQPDTEFSTYAYYRISGAIYEGLTRMNWTSRAEYRRRKAEAAANEVLLQDAVSQNAMSQNAVSQSAVSQRRSGSSADIATWIDATVKQLSAVFVLSQMPDSDGRDDDPTDPGQGPLQAVVGVEMQQMVNQAVAGLPVEAQQLIRLVYFEDYSLAQAAQAMGKSRSWASRFHGAILEKLATRLTGVEE